MGRAALLAIVGLALRTHLLARDRAGRSTRLRLASRWACRSNRIGAVTTLAARPERRSRRSRPAPSVAITGRHRVPLGRATTLTVRVRNGGQLAAHDVIVRADLPRAIGRPAPAARAAAAAT